MMAAALCVVATITLAGCSKEPQTPPQQAPSATTEQPTSAPPQVNREKQQAKKTVVAVMKEYFDTDRSQEKWYAAIEPYLSADARYLYEDSNKDNIPKGANVTAAPKLRSDEDASLTYTIDTTDGTYTLILVLEGDHGGAYAVDEIRTATSGAYD